MSVSKLENYLPPGTLPHLKHWFGTHGIHIRITRGRESKLGDYRKMPDGSHQITVNSTLQPQLFFFVLTHELAHLLAFEEFGRRIAPHGTEWKTVFRRMLLESLDVYDLALRPVITAFSRSPKANFMASPALVRYFHITEEGSGKIFMENLRPGERFRYRQNTYELIALQKKNYLCQDLASGRKYLFKPVAEVEKI